MASALKPLIAAALLLAASARAQDACPDLRRRAEELRNGASNCDAAVAQGQMSSCRVSVTFSLADVPSFAGTVPADVPWLTSPAAARDLAAKLDAVKCVEKLEITVDPPGPFQPGDKFTITAKVTMANGASPEGLVVSLAPKDEGLIAFNDAGADNGTRVAHKAGKAAGPMAPLAAAAARLPVGADGVARFPGVFSTTAGGIKPATDGEEVDGAIDPTIGVMGILMSKLTLGMNIAATTDCKALSGITISPAKAITRIASKGGPDVGFSAKLPAGMGKCSNSVRWSLSREDLGVLAPRAGMSATFAPANKSGSVNVRVVETESGKSAQAEVKVIVCTPEEHEELNTRMHGVCDQPHRCSPGQTCEQLIANEGIFSACIALRNAVIAACYPDNMDPTENHWKAIRDETAGLVNCQGMINNHVPPCVAPQTETP